MTATVDADLFPTPQDAIEFVASRGGGTVFLFGAHHPYLLHGLKLKAEKLGVQIVLNDMRRWAEAEKTGAD